MPPCQSIHLLPCGEPRQRKYPPSSMNMEYAALDFPCSTYSWTHRMSFVTLPLGSFQKTADGSSLDDQMSPPRSDLRS